MKTYYFISSFSVIMTFICFWFFIEIEKPKHQFDWTSIRNNVKDTILAIEKHGEVTSKFVGYSANLSPQYNRAKWFMAKASKDELIKLMNYDNSTVKAYSFKALLKQGDDNIYNYIINSYYEDSIVYIQNGCIGQDIPIFNYYIKLISPPYLKEELANNMLKFSHSQRKELNRLIELYNLNDKNLFQINNL